MLVAGLVTLTGAGGAQSPAQSDNQLGVRAFRFYRAEGRETLVTGLIEIPYRVLTPSAADQRLIGDVAVAVKDSAGLELHRSSWRLHAPMVTDDPDAALMEVIEFALRPGRYDLQVSVQDSATGRTTVQSVPIQAFGAAPPASDVVLSPSIRLPEPGDTTLAPGEVRRGNMIVTPAGHLRLTPLRSRVFYLVEVYGGGDSLVTMTARVQDQAGKPVITSAARRVPVAAGGAVLRGQLDLAGLPAGEYRLAVRLERGGVVEERSDDFTMADFSETMARERDRLAALKETDEGFFGSMNEEQLDEAEAPLVYLASKDSLNVWKSGLSVKAKREFLTRFWQQRDPTPGTVRNETREAFYQRIEQANQQFGEPGRTLTPGWRTDRGRIAILYGEPNDQLDRRTSSGTAPPYQVWRYQRGRERYYIFADRTGFGGYRLIASNDLKETGTPGFRELLGGEALQDISRWLGIDLFRGDQGGRLSE